MAYQTYTTDAVVCGSYDRNTSDRSYLLLTRDNGTLFADARSVREERSRQRYALQEMSWVRVSLVRGKGGWRVGSVVPLENLYHALNDRMARRVMLAHVRLIKQFVHGVEVPPTVFTDSIDLFRRLQTAAESDYSALQTLAAFRLHHALGYVVATESTTVLLTQTFADIPLPTINAVEPELAAAIAVATSVSHL